MDIGQRGYHLLMENVVPMDNRHLIAGFVMIVLVVIMTVIILPLQQLMALQLAVWNILISRL